MDLGFKYLGVSLNLISKWYLNIFFLLVVFHRGRTQRCGTGKNQHFVSSFFFPWEIYSKVYMNRWSPLTFSGWSSILLNTTLHQSFNWSSLSANLNVNNSFLTYLLPGTCLWSQSCRAWWAGVWKRGSYTSSYIRLFDGDEEQAAGFLLAVE